jgi:CRISPR-associated protein Cmr1
MGWTDLTLTVRTPMFLGLENMRTDQLRADTDVAFPVPSLRGALRHWLRALLGAEIGNDLRRLAAAETAVFGAAADRNRPPSQGGPGPSRVAIQAPRALRYTPAGTTPDWLRRPGGGRGTSAPNPAGYLLGPGMYDAVHDTLRRPFITPGTPIPLRVRVRADSDGAATDLFWCALWALRTFGGLGARTRRGYGTLTVIIPPNTDLGGAHFHRHWLDRNRHDDLDTVLACARTALNTIETAGNDTGANTGAPPGHDADEPGGTPHLGAPPTATPTYPAFLPGTYETIDEPLGTTPTATLADALAATGEKLRAFRTGVPDNPHAATEEWETILRPWLDNDQTGLSKPFQIGAIGLPVVYSQKLGQEGGKAATRTVTVTPRQGTTELRRASPLWLRIYPDDTGHWRLRSLALLAEWLPPDSQLVARTKGRPPQPLTKPTQQQVNTLLHYWFE